MILPYSISHLVAIKNRERLKCKFDNVSNDPYLHIDPIEVEDECWPDMELVWLSPHCSLFSIISLFKSKKETTFLWEDIPNGNSLAIKKNGARRVIPNPMLLVFRPSFFPKKRPLPSQIISQPQLNNPRRNGFSPTVYKVPHNLRQ